MSGTLRVSDAMKFSGSYLIAGSTGAIGSALARLVIAGGGTPLLFGRNAELLRAQAAELGGLEYRVADLFQPETVGPALKELPSDLRGVAYAAGSVTLKPLRGATPDDFATSLALNAISAAETVIPDPNPNPNPNPSPSPSPSPSPNPNPLARQLELEQELSPEDNAALAEGAQPFLEMDVASDEGWQRAGGDSKPRRDGARAGSGAGAGAATPRAAGSQFEVLEAELDREKRKMDKKARRQAEREAQEDAREAASAQVS